MSGMSWMFIALLLFFVGAGALTAIIRPIRRVARPAIGRPSEPPAASQRSFVGVDSFDTTDGGVTFANVEPPGSPADKAGMVGGDIVTKFDGHKIESEDQIRELLEDTPIGKTVEVVYLRDGETKTTKLTTVGEKDFERLNKEFRGRPEGMGRFGFDDDRIEVVEVPGTKLHGVRLEEGAISPSLPADMAGVKDGDIIVEFGNAPIRTTSEMRQRVRRALPYSTVPVVVFRGSERIEIPVKMGRQQ
jgi:S1-C subfamily serine protease